MKLKDLESVLRGVEVAVQYKEFQPRYTIIEFKLKVYEIKELPLKYLNAEVLRINLDDKVPSIFIEME